MIRLLGGVASFTSCSITNVDPSRSIKWPHSSPPAESELASGTNSLWKSSFVELSLRRSQLDSKERPPSDSEENVLESLEFRPSLFRFRNDGNVPRTTRRGKLW